MASVSHLLVFVLVCLATQVLGSDDIVLNAAVGSVREYPANLHRCNAAFVSPTFLVTTSTCLLCTSDCRLFVTSIRFHMNREGPPHNVKRIYIHPHYEADTKSFDVGIVELDRPATYVTLLKLPSKSFYGDIHPGLTYTWHFTRDKKDYKLRFDTVHTISNRLCSLFFREYVPHNIVCSKSDELITPGLLDQGSPLTAVINKEDFIMGFMPHAPKTSGSYVQKYMSILPFKLWIESIIWGLRD